jgi:hypothetical protein
MTVHDSGQAVPVTLFLRSVENDDMIAPRKPDRESDPFRPPEVPTKVACLHCGREYDSHLIEWREEPDENGRPAGFWCCPTPGCDGKGFGFDILPTDPEYRDERGGWVCCDDDCDDDEEEEECEFEE